MDTSKPLDLLTVDEAMAELRIQKSTLYKLMNEGRVKALRLAGTDKVLIPRAELIGLLEVWTPRAVFAGPRRKAKQDEGNTTAE